MNRRTTESEGSHFLGFAVSSSLDEGIDGIFRAENVRVSIIVTVLDPGLYVDVLVELSVASQY